MASAWLGLEEVRRVREALDLVERQFHFFLGNEDNLYVLHGDGDWTLVRFSGHLTEWVGNIQRSDGASLYWPSPTVEVLAAADSTKTSYSLCEYDFASMARVPFENIPLYISGGYVSPVLLDMLRKTEPET